MNRKQITNPTDKKSNRHALLAQMMLCLYMIVNSIKYIEGFPVALNSLFLYGYIIFGVFDIFCRMRLQVNVHSLMMMAFFCVCLVGSLFSRNVETSVEKTVNFFKVMLFFVVFANVVNSQKRVEGVLFANSLATISLFIYLLANDMLDSDQRLGNELTGNANIFASLFMMGAFGSVYLMLCRKPRIPGERILHAATFVVQEYAMALSGGRKFFILPILLLCGILAFAANKKGKRHILRNGLIAACAIVAVFWALLEVEELYLTIGHRMEGLLNYFTGEGVVDASTAARDRLAVKGMQLWLDSPIFGYGIDTFKDINSIMNVYSHNNYVEVLCGTGLVGAIIYYACHAVILFKLLCIKKKDIRACYWIFAMLCMLAYDFGAVSYDDYSTHVILASATMYVYIHDKQELTTEEKEKSNECVQDIRKIASK